MYMLNTLNGKKPETIQLRVNLKNFTEFTTKYIALEIKWIHSTMGNNKPN